MERVDLGEALAGYGEWVRVPTCRPVGPLAAPMPDEVATRADEPYQPTTAIASAMNIQAYRNLMEGTATSQPGDQLAAARLAAMVGPLAAPLPDFFADRCRQCQRILPAGLPGVYCDECRWYRGQ